MKRFLLILLTCLICSFGSFAQTDNSANPVSLGLLLIDQPSVEKMITTCRYYNLLEEPSQEGYNVFRHPNGTVYQFKVDERNSQHFPIVKVTTKDSQKTLDNILTQSGYKKESGVYVKGTKFEHRRTKCSITGNAKKTLTFQKEYNSLE
ncbi:MAG: hypothetical protein K2J78_06855 [Muribaculaceae bacterium]|nr:hypothetical protein [Muribaculaceae bacterium]